MRIFDTPRAEDAEILKQSKTELLKALSKCHYTLKMLTNGHINCAYFTFAFRCNHLANSVRSSSCHCLQWCSHTDARNFLTAGLTYRDFSLLGRFLTQIFFLLAFISIRQKLEIFRAIKIAHSLFIHRPKLTWLSSERPSFVKSFFVPFF